MSEFQRAIDFCNAIEGAVAGPESIAFDAGLALIDTTMPDVWDANYLRVDRSGVMDAAQLVEAADRIQGGAGLAHRSIGVADEAEGRLLEPGFQALGWKIERNVFMFLRREPDQPRVAVTHISDAQVAPLRLAMLGEDDSTRAEGVANGLRRVEAAMDATGYGSGWFVAPAAPPAATCRLLSDGVIGQIEDVATLRAERSKGYGSSVVNAAAGASVAAGHELTFVIADQEDWVKGLYAKLGFEPAAEAFVFRH